MALSKGGNLSLTKQNPSMKRGLVDLRRDDRSTNGADEQILVQLDRQPTAVQKIAITMTIHDAAARRQSFRQVDNAFICVLNNETQREVVRYDLTSESCVPSDRIGRRPEGHVRQLWPEDRLSKSWKHPSERCSAELIRGRSQPGPAAPDRRTLLLVHPGA